MRRDKYGRREEGCHDASRIYQITLSHHLILVPTTISGSGLGFVGQKGEVRLRIVESSKACKNEVVDLRYL